MRTTIFYLRLKLLIKAVIFVLFLISQINIAQSLPLNGIYTIGGISPDYSTFTAAVSSLVTNGVNGPVVFKIRTGIYNEQIQINNISGVSESSTITFVSETGNQNDVVLKHAHSNTPVDYTIYINGADYIIFKNFTIQAEKTPVSTSYNRVIHITNNSDHIKFENNIIKSWFITQDYFEFNDCISIVSNSANTNDSIYFTDNTIIGGYRGIYRQGDTNTNGLFVYNNTFYDQSNSSIYSSNCSNTNITGNKFYSFYNLQNYNGIYIYGNNNQLNIDRNYILLRGAGTGICVYYLYAGLKENKLICNNMIVFNKVVSSGKPIGIKSYSNDSVLIVYNSIHINSTDTLGYAIESTNNDFIYIYNNQLIHKGGGLCYFADGNTSGIFKSDYNNLFNNNNALAKYNNILYNNLSSLSSQPNIEQHSIITNPEFLNDSLLIPYNPLIFNSGIPIIGINHDFYNNIRSSTATDIGVYEGDSAQYDIGIINNNFENYLPCTSDSVPFYIKLKNFGTTTLTSAEIRCTSLDSADYHIYWTGNLTQNQTQDSIFVGYFSFSKKEKIEIKAWVYNPNGQNDNISQNDTMLFTSNTAMSGSYSIGTGNADYNTISSAVNDLINYGVCGPVVFNINPGNYIEQINITSIMGTSAFNTITFQSANLDSSSVIVKYNTNYSNANYVIRLASVNNIQIKKITIQPLGYTYVNGILLENNSSNNLISNNNFIITGNISPNVVSGFVNLNSSGNNIISKNRFYNGYWQMTLSGSSLNNTITNNIFEGNCIYNIISENQKDLSITKNLFRGSSYTVIELKNCIESIHIEKNKINVQGVNLTLINMESCNGTIAKPIIIKNNFISGTANTSANYIRLQYVSNIKILNNSLYLKRYSDICLNISSFLYCTSINFYNNIISCKDSGAFYMLPVIDTSIFHSDYNSFYSTNQFTFSSYNYPNSTAYSFNSWKIATGLDQHSIFTLPNFVNDSNLHIQNTTAIKGKGKYFAEITDDIDDESRNILTPDIGADEFPIDSATYFDVSLSEIIYPDNQVCFKTDSLKIKVINHSNFQMTSLDVRWKLFGQNTVNKHVIININAYDSVYINLGYFDFVPNTLYNFDFEIYNPNNHIDNYPDNNTKSIQYCYLGNTKIFKKQNTDCNTNTELYIKNFPRNSVLWSTGSVQNSIIVNYTGNYSVTVTGINGCIISDSIILN